MFEPYPTRQDSVAEQLRETAKRLNLMTLSEVTPTCQTCERHIAEGQSITVYLTQSPDGRGYNVTQVRCENHNGDMDELFSIDSRELIVAGRVGKCRDQGTQTDWPVLIAPVIRKFSHQNSDGGRSIYLNDQPTDIEDPFAGFKPTVAGMTEPSWPSTVNKD